MTEKLDKKFYGEIRKAKDDSIVPEDQWIVFLAQDNAVPGMLHAYLAVCIAQGADAEHIEGVRQLTTRVVDWRLANYDKCKAPDAAGERMLP